MTAWNFSGAQGPSLPELHNTIIVAAFEGWNDAGDAASDALEHLDAIWEAQPIVEIDDESYYDYQVNRPVIRQVDGVIPALERRNDDGVVEFGKAGALSTAEVPRRHAPSLSPARLR